MKRFFAILIISLNTLVYSGFSSKFLDAKKIPPLNEIKDKLELAKVILKEQCFDADAVTPFVATDFNVTQSEQRFVSSWGCTNTDGSLNDLVAVHATALGDIGFLSKAKIMLVSLDQVHNRIDSDAANIASRYATAWCLKVVDTDATDGISVTNNVDMDGDGNTDRSISSMLGYRECGTL